MLVALTRPIPLISQSVLLRFCFWLVLSNGKNYMERRNIRYCGFPRVVMRISAWSIQWPADNRKLGEIKDAEDRGNVRSDMI